MNLIKSKKKFFSLFFIFIQILINKTQKASSRSIIIANYHNVLLFFPKEYGGNDDLRVIFDVRNATIGTFKYMPVIVDVAYDSLLNNAYCYLESAVTSYILLLKWAGGAWCYQVLFEFPASQFSKYMYHSVILMDDFLYWTTDRYIMSGRTPGYEKRLLLQPGWNRLFSMTANYDKQLIYVSAFDYTENAIFRCSLRVFSCTKLLTTDFTINQVKFNSFTKELYASSIQGVQNKFLYRYAEDFNTLLPVKTVEEETSDMIFLDNDLTILTNQQTITITKNINLFNSFRKSQPKLVDPYALQYTFTFNQVLNFDTYPYPYFFTDYHDLLYKNSLYFFYYYICGLDFVENDNAFLPQMDLNNQFLRIDNCQNRFIQDRDAYIIPSIIAGLVTLLLIIIIITICFCRSKMCEPRLNKVRSKFKSCFSCCLNKNDKEKNKFPNVNNVTPISSISSKQSLDLNKTKTLNDNLTYFSKTSPILNIIEDKTYDNDNIRQSNFFLNTCLQQNQNKKSMNNNKPSNLKKNNGTKSAEYSLPTFSQSSASSNDFDRPFSVISPTSSISAISNNRVKFNDYKIHHFYEKDDYPNNKNKNIKSKFNEEYPFEQEYINLNNNSYFSNSYSSNSSPSLLNQEYIKTNLKSLDKRKTKILNKDYISNCDVKIYAPNNSFNFMDISKSIEQSEKKINV